MSSNIAIKAELKKKKKTCMQKVLIFEKKICSPVGFKHMTS